MIDLIGTAWRRRDDGWIGQVELTERRRGGDGRKREFVRLVNIPEEGDAESELVLAEKIEAKFERICETRCRRCRAAPVWRIAGDGDRYVAHGCAARQRELREGKRRAERRRRDRARRRYHRLMAASVPGAMLSLPILIHERRRYGRGVTTIAGVRGISLQQGGALVRGEVFVIAFDDVRAGDEVAILRGGKLGARTGRYRRTEGFFQNATWMMAAKRGAIARIRIT
ncbi:MAG: hypothetical protein V4537_14565 [Pseudomonadota bacterium]